MKYANKNIKEFKKKLWWILFAFILLLLISYSYISYLKKLTYNNVYTNISEIGRQNAAKLKLTIDSQKKFVEQIIHSINNNEFDTIDDIFDSFTKNLESNHLTRLAILDKYGNGTTSDGKNVKNYPDIQEFFKNENVRLSENRPSTVSNNQVNIYSKTFKFNGKDYVLFATINTEQYKEIISQRIFNGNGGTYLINNEGIVLIDSFDTITTNNVNLFTFLKDTYNIKNKYDLQQLNFMKSSIENNNIGSIHITLNKDTYFMNFEQLGINDWYVITVAPNSVIAKEITTFLIISLGICLLLIFIIISVFIYISVSNEIKKQRLYKLAYIDPITSIGNSIYFKEKGTIHLNNKTENKYLLALDINKFKALNNIHGYNFGNKILKSLANKLIKTLPENNITCRMSNDIFAAIFDYEKNIENLLNRIFNYVSNIEIDGTKLHLNLSIGVYKIHLNDVDINKVLDKAYMARAKIKGLYNANYYIFDDVLESILIEEQQIESSMEKALKNKEFKVVYQPKTFTKNEKIAGAEALVRWYKDDGTIISPGKFIPLFEKNKFIMKLDLYIFEQVCKDMASWKEKYGFTPTISINVSKEHFVDENFIDKYAKIADKYKVERSKIDLEITESATVSDNIDILKILNNIKEKGFIISIDDFGTGYSSLSMLQHMPINIIKIDKIFIDKADLNSNKNIINYIMFIATNLGVKTIVEGVETKEQVDFIRKIKCDMIQGYYYSKPIPKGDFEDYFNNHK